MAARFDTLADWLAWQQTHHPKAIDLGLDRVRTVAERLGVLRPSARVITVAGTNGKGSCVATLEALLGAVDKRFGAYTSPHLLHYNERIRLQARPVDDLEICKAFARIDEARGEISLTYFEFGTLAALDIFNRQTLDYWLLEVGLGGRLDAVNIIDADIACITSIAIDHEAWLGSTREQIGFEKSGICRFQRPLVLADYNPPESLINHAQSLNCDIFRWGNDFGVAQEGEIFTRKGLRVPLSTINLPKTSVAAAVQICELEHCLPAMAALKKIVAKTSLPGRMQSMVCGHLQLLLDVAHNPAAAELLAIELVRRQLTPVLAVVAMMDDKDIIGSLAPFKNSVIAWHCVTLPDNPRAAVPKKLADILVNDLAVPSNQVFAGASVAETLALLERSSQSGSPSHKSPTVLIFGSFFTVAEALSYLPVKDSLPV
jgi:dihydrofolate synthase/folylpolyglutamate synthase